MFKFLRCLLVVLAYGVTAAAPASAQIGTSIPFAYPQFFTDTGAICNGCKLHTYAATTLNDLATYSDAALMTQNANPVVLSASGRALIFLTPASYKLVLTTSTGAAIWTIDNVAAGAPWNLSSLAGKVSFSAPTVLTVAGNAVAPTQNVHALDTSGGAVNLNTLTTTNVTSGFLLTLYGNNPGANPVTVKDGAGNITLGSGDYALSASTRVIQLVLIGSTWREVSRATSTIAIPSPLTALGHIGATSTKLGIYTLLATDDTILANGTFDVTLLTAIGRAGQSFTIKNIGTGTITIQTTAAQTIDGAANLALTSQFDSVTVMSDGANWFVL